MHKITEIRYDGFYLEDYDELLLHSEITSELLETACSLVDEVEFWQCDGITFIDDKPHAELIDFNGGLTYREL